MEEKTRYNSPTIGDNKLVPREKPEKVFGKFRTYLEWCIEWEQTTGELLASQSKTEQAGIEKLANAESRRKQYEMLKSQRLI